MFAVCYALEAFLQSTLECFYDQQCIDSNNTFKAMEIFNSTIEMLVNELMVEEYSNNIPYKNYFVQCAPSSYTGKINIIEGITTLISLYGGLVVIAELFGCRTQTVRSQTD